MATGNYIIQITINGNTKNIKITKKIVDFKNAFEG